MGVARGGRQRNQVIDITSVETIATMRIVSKLEGYATISASPKSQATWQTMNGHSRRIRRYTSTDTSAHSAIGMTLQP
jgi:hypothetical protein